MCSISINSIIKISSMVCIIGLALLQKHGNLPDLQTDLVEAPHKLMREAAVLHPFAEACYTVGHYLIGTYFLCMPALYDMERYNCRGHFLMSEGTPFCFHAHGFIDKAF